MPLSAILIATGLILLYASNTIGGQLLSLCLIIIVCALIVIFNKLGTPNSLLNILVAYHFKRWVQLEIDGMRVCADNALRPSRISFKNTPSLNLLRLIVGK